MFRKNTASQFIHFQGVDATTGGIKSGVTWTIRRCIDGTFAAATGSTSEDSTNGWYKFAMSQADTNGNNIAFNFTGTGAVPQTVNIVTDGSPPDINLKNAAGTAVTLDSNNVLNVSTKYVGGTLQTARDIGLSVLLASGQKVDVDTIKTNPVVNAGTVTFPSGATLASTTNITAGTITTTTNLTNLPAITSGWLTAAGIAADTGFILRANTATASAAGTLTLDAGATTTVDYYKDCWLVITSSTGIGQARRISTYSAGRVASVTPNWATTPSSTSTYAILPSGYMDVGAILGTASAGAAGSVGIDWAQVANPSSTVNLSATTTNLVNTATTATTATNLTNAPTNGDLTAAMKTSVTTACTASTPTAAAVTGAVGSVTGAVGSVTGNVGGNVTGSVGSIASAGITRASFSADSGHATIRSNTAQAGAGTSITLDASASAVNSFYVNDLVLTTGGTGAGQARFITAYDGSTKVATVSAWATNPDNTTTFAILPFDAVPGATAPTASQVATAVWTDLLASSDFSTSASIGKLLKDDIDAAVSSRMATYTQPTGFLAATFPTGTVANTTNITAGTMTTTTNLTNAPTSGDFTATMKTSLNNATPSVTVSDKTGFSLSSAGIQAIWDALTSALTTVGSIGKLLVTNIDTTISSRSTLTQTQVTGGAYSVQSSSCVLGDARIAHLDADISSRGTSTLTQTQVTGGAYTVQSASCVLGDARIAHLDADVSSRLATSGYTPPLDAAGTRTAVGLATANLDTQLSTIAGYVDTEVAAIKAKTDNLPAAPAAVGDIPTANQNADALLDRADSIETGTTLRQWLRLAGSVLLGKLSGAGTGTEVFRDIADTKDRVIAAVDSSGNRTAITKDAS